MRNKIWVLKTSLCIVIIGAIFLTLVINLHLRDVNNANGEKNNLITCLEHIDVDGDMLCDLCSNNIGRTSYANVYEIKNPNQNQIENKIVSKIQREVVDDDMITVSGNMPKGTNLALEKVSIKKAEEIAKEFYGDETANVVFAYDISLKENGIDYVPVNEEYEVKVHAFNSGKVDKILHIKDDGTIEEIDELEVVDTSIKFKTESFSQYIGVSTQLLGDETAIITKWNITAGQPIKLPIDTTEMDIYVDWGDGTKERITATTFPEHTYDETGTYKIAFTGNCASFGYRYESGDVVDSTSDYYTYMKQFLSLEQVGSVGLKELGFSYCENATKINLTGFDSSKMTDMSYMFYNCKNVVELDVSSLDTSNVTDMSYMFYYCYSVPELNLSSFDTTNVTDMSYMFYYCYNVLKLDLTSFNTNNVTDMSYMFYYCYNVPELNLSSFDTTNVTDMSYMFYYCYSVLKLDLSSFGTTNVTDMSYMFYYCYNVTELDLSSFNTSNVTDMSYMFFCCYKVLELDLNSFDTTNVTNMSYMFHFCRDVLEMDLSSFNTSKVTNMKNMFYGCRYVTELDLSSFDTTNVTDMTNMFSSCSKLTTLDLSSFDTSNVTNMSKMFSGCNFIENLNLSSLNTAKVTDMTSMFYSCRNLKELDLSNFDTNKVTNFWGMFLYCESLTYLDLSSFDTTNVKDTRNMFNTCTNLETLVFGEKFKKLNTSNMFGNTSSLKKIILLSETPNQTITSSGISQFAGNFYVPNLESQNSYKATWSGKVNATRIKPILEVEISNKIVLNSLIEKKYKVAGFLNNEPEMYEKLGFSVIESGDIKTNEVGEYTVEYILNRFFSGETTEIMREMRTIQVVNTEENSMAMITEWTIPSDETLIKLPVSGTGLSITVDWGDGNVESVSGDLPEHTYALAGTYDISITGKCPTFGYRGGSSVDTNSSYYTFTQYMTGVKQWGELEATSYGFSYCSALEYVLNNATQNSFKNVTNMSSMFTNCKVLETVDLSNIDISNVTSIGSMFSQCTVLKEVNLNMINSVSLTDMNTLFNACYALEKMEWNTLNTEKVMYMGKLFYECYSLQNINLTSFNTSNVVDMNRMFYGCIKLKELDLSSFNTYLVTNFEGMFNDCSNLEKLNLGSNFLTDSASTMSSMFANCSSLQELDVSNFNTSNVTGMAFLFGGCESLKTLDLSSFDTSKVTSMEYMFGECKNLKTLNISSFNTSNVTNMQEMFIYCYALEELDLSKFDTSKVTSMDNMFLYCKTLKTLDVSSFNTSNVVNLGGMFAVCDGLEELDLTSFDTTSATDILGMFESSKNLKKIIFGEKFNISRVTAIDGLFYNCTSLEEVNLNVWDTSNVTNMALLFYNCKNLKNIDLSPLDTSNVTNMGNMFNNCNSLIDVDLSSFNTSNVTNMSNMFYNCSSLVSLDLSPLDITKVTNVTNMINNCTNLEVVYLGNNTKFIYTPANTPNFKGFIIGTSVSSSDDITYIPSSAITFPVTSAIYVPDDVTRDAYRTKWSAVVNGDRIRNYLELINTNEMTITKGEEYIEPGFIALGYEENEIYKLSNLELELVVSNKPNTLEIGTYPITYSLRNLNDGQVISETVRYVTVIGGSKVELYANNKPYTGDWVNQITAMVTIQNADSVSIEYKISDIGEWTSENASITIKNGVATVNLNHDFIEDEVYFREVGANGKATTIESDGYMYRQEKLLPKVKDINFSTTDKKIIIEAILEDENEVLEYCVLVKGQEPKDWIQAPVQEITSGDETIQLDNVIVNIEEEALGSNTYVVWVKDKAGNITQSEEIKIVKDITPPTGTIAIKDAKNVNGELYVNTEEIVLLITAEDNVSTQEEIQMAVYNEVEYEAMQDKSLIEWESLQNKKTWKTEDGDGKKRIYVLLKDAAGNIAPKIIEYR